jgi:hypothetical protein
MADEIANITGNTCQKFKCSARGLLLPFGKHIHYFNQTLLVLYN